MPLQPLPEPPKPKAEGVEYRLLTPEEIQSCAPIFAEKGNPLPDPAISQFVGAVEDGKVIGFLVLQLKLHAQPMWIAEGQSQIFASLAHAAEKVILERTGPAWVYLFAPAGKMSQLAQSMGMQLEPWNVLSKLVMYDPPEQGTLELSEPEIPTPASKPKRVPVWQSSTTEVIQ